MKTTDDVMREMERAFQRKVRRDAESHKASQDFVRSVCDSGLVDDVTPSGPATAYTLTCTGCQQLVPEEDIICLTCPPGTPCRIG